MEEQTREFKGVWIPKEIWLDKRLTFLEKVILIEIDSLDSEEKGCWASNEYLAEFCQCSITKVSLAITKLLEMEYLELQSFNGRQRILKSRLSKSERQTLKKLNADIKKVKATNIDDNNTSNNKEDIYICEFEKLWKLYPRKIAKPNALKSYIKARKKGVSYEDIERGVKAYAEYVKGKDSQYTKHGSTWFNQECWNDDLRVEQKNDGYCFNPDDEMELPY